MNFSGWILPALLAIIILSFTNKKGNMKISQGQAAPSFTIKDVNGSTVNLSDYKGKKILLTFYRFLIVQCCRL